MNIGVRDLKQNLSKYLDQAANGEMVVVTDRGVPKVLIVQVEIKWQRALKKDGLRLLKRLADLVRLYV
jgi:prevent-host-death family protein